MSGVLMESLPRGMSFDQKYYDYIMFNSHICIYYGHIMLALLDCQALFILINLKVGRRYIYVLCANGKPAA